MSDAVERVARALCRYTWEREFSGKNLDAYVEIHWTDHAAAARAALATQQDSVREAARKITVQIMKERHAPGKGMTLPEWEAFVIAILEHAGD